MGACLSAPTTAEKLGMMKTSPFYTHLSEETCTRFAYYCTVVSYPENFRIYSEEQRCSELYLIVEGEVQLTALDSDAFDQFLCIKKKGQFFGEQGVLSDQVFPARNSSATTKTPLRVLVMTRPNFRRFKADTGVDETLRLILGEGVAENLKRVPFLAGLSPWKLQMLGNMFAYQSVERDAQVFREGDLGTDLYIISKGRVVATAQQQQRDGKMGVHKFREMVAGDYFGEIALMINTPRTATITALEKTLLLVLSKEGFTNFMNLAPDVQSHFARVAKHRVTALFKTFNVPFFQAIAPDKFHQLSRACEIEQYTSGAVIFEQGDAGDKFYLIPYGSVEVLIKQTHSSQYSRVCVLQRGQFFGEIALVTDLPRTASVRTLSYCVLLAIPREKFRRFVLDTPQAYADFSLKLSRYEVPLSAILLHRNGIRYFTDFLEMEYSGENLQFWHEVKRYSSIANDEKRFAEAQRMYNTYISSKGSKQVNLPATVREELERNMTDPAKMTQRLFRRAQLEIEIMLSHDSFKRFKESPLFDKLLLEVGSYSDQNQVDAAAEAATAAVSGVPASPRNRAALAAAAGSGGGAGASVSVSVSVSANGVGGSPFTPSANGAGWGAAAAGAGAGAGFGVDMKSDYKSTRTPSANSRTISTSSMATPGGGGARDSASAGRASPNTPGRRMAQNSFTNRGFSRVLSIERPAALSVESRKDLGSGRRMSASGGSGRVMRSFSKGGEPLSGGLSAGLSAGLSISADSRTSELAEPGSGRLINPMLQTHKRSSHHERRASGLLDQIVIETVNQS